MESVNEIKEQLSARSRTATLDELANEGRKRVRLIRAEHIAQMVSEAVHSAIDDSGLLGREEVDALVESSQAEFRTVLREREQELQAAREHEAQREAGERELEQLQARFQEVTSELALANAELQQVRDELDAEREQARAAVEAQEGDDEAASVPADVMRAMIQELADVKASIAQPGAAEPGAPQGGADLTAAFDKLAGALNDRLDSFGKKMGISAAVGGDAPVDLGGVFESDGGAELESNMDNIKVKQKAAGGIAANLAKLKKLKGGG